MDSGGLTLTELCSERGTVAEVTQHCECNECHQILCLRVVRTAYEFTTANIIWKGKKKTKNKISEWNVALPSSQLTFISTGSILPW